MTINHSNNDSRDGLARIELCVPEIREWMNQNMLKLNEDKTELIRVGVHVVNRRVFSRSNKYTF